jgi:asparagine synthase (glutamine-hydrolysing)
VSGIFGVIDLAGDPVSRATVERMTAQARVLRHDGVHHLQSGAALLGHALRTRTPEDQFTDMPQVDDARQIIVTAAGRLDNREELADALGLSTAERDAMADSSLMVHAYLRWGDEAPRRMLGDWMCAAWHVRDRRLFLARDHLGNASLHYWHKGTRVVFASDVSVLFAVPGVERRVDDEQIGRHLTVQPGNIARTFFADIARIPPAHAVALTTTGTRRWRYWHPTDAAPISFRADDEYEEAFLEHFRRAVSTRLRSSAPVASMLSAGLDSGAVTALAAEALAGRGEELTAWTAAPHFPVQVPGRTVDETAIAAQTAARWPNIRHVVLTSAGACPVRSIERLCLADGEPIHGVTNLYWMFDLMERAHVAGGRVLLTGQLGNGSVSWSGGSAWEFHALRERPWAPWLPLRSYWKRGRAAGLGPGVVRVVRAVRQRSSRRHDAVGPWPLHAAAAPAFLERLERQGALTPNPDLPVGQARLCPRAERALMLELNGVAVAGVLHRWRLLFGLDVRDPTADVRLVQYCCGVPNTQYVLHGGRRMLIRRSMRGLMASQALADIPRGLQGADIAARLRASRTAVEATLERLEGSPVVGQYLDLQRLRGAWQAVHGDAGLALAPAAALMRGITVGCFVEQVASHRSLPDNAVG